MTTIVCKGHRFENIEAVLFDKDGTLAEVEAYLLSLGKARAEQVDRVVPGTGSDILLACGQQANRLNPAGLMAVGSRTDNEIAAAAYVAARGVDWVTALELVKRAFDLGAQQLPVKVEQTPMLPGAIALLQQLGARGLKIGIVSSDTHAEVAAFISHHRLNIDWYCGVGSAALSKPQPGFLNLACEKMKVSPTRVLIIGDSAADVALAGQGGAGFIGMVGGWRKPPQFEADVATVTHLREIETRSE